MSAARMALELLPDFKAESLRWNADGDLTPIFLSEQARVAEAIAEAIILARKESQLR
jgi:hypothetical protein